MLSNSPVASAVLIILIKSAGNVFPCLANAVENDSPNVRLYTMESYNLFLDLFFPNCLLNIRIDSVKVIPDLI